MFLFFFLRLAKQSQFIPLQNVVYFIKLPFLVRKIFTFYINDVLLFKCPVPGPKSSKCTHTQQQTFEVLTTMCRINFVKFTACRLVIYYANFTKEFMLG